MSVYLVATSTPPDIVCPPWCDRTEVHLAELDDWGGVCLHQWHASPADTPSGRPIAVTLAITLLPDGTVHPSDRRTHGELGLIVEGSELDLDAGEALANQILAMVAAGRAITSQETQR